MRVSWIPLLLSLLVPTGPAAAQPSEGEVPTVLIEGGGLDIYAGATGPEGRVFRGRSPADFPLLFTLQRDFVGQIPEDAKAAELE